MPAKKKARRVTHEGVAEEENAPPDREIVDSEIRPDMYIPGGGGEALQVGPQAVDVSEYEGSYHKKDEPDDAEPYGLKIVENDPYGHTHHAQNQDHHWSGTKDQFEAQFVAA